MHDAFSGGDVWRVGSNFESEGVRHLLSGTMEARGHGVSLSWKVRTDRNFPSTTFAQRESASWKRGYTVDANAKQLLSNSFRAKKNTLRSKRFLSPIFPS